MDWEIKVFKRHIIALKSTFYLHVKSEVYCIDMGNDCDVTYVNEYYGKIYFMTNT